jgi:hypothetical protein
MNGYSEILRYIKTLAEQDYFINTITQGDFEDVDISKKNIFPLLHISIGNCSFPSDSVIRFDCQIGAMDIRDINKEITTDKFYDNDNEIDNLNETLAVVNRLWLLMLKDFEENDITASENPTLEQMSESKKNLLDGWVMTFTIDVPNILVSLC